MRYTFLFIIGLIGLCSCKQNPKACLELEDGYEVGREYKLTSCSKNYEFLTWDFGDRSGGFIGDEAPHIFQNKGTFYVTVTAYSDGAYNSDQASVSVKAASRYVDHIDITGESDFTKFRFEFGNNKVTFSDAVGTFTDTDPFRGNVLDSVNIKIPLDQVQISLFGQRNSSATPLVNKYAINFRNNVENPVELEGQGFNMKLYWSYQ